MRTQTSEGLTVVDDDIAPLQLSTEAAVGMPYTTYDKVPPVMGDAPTARRTEIVKEAALAEGAVAKVKVWPPSLETGTIEGVELEDTTKSPAAAVVDAKSFETEMVHEILPPTLKGDGGEQDSDEAVLGIPAVNKNQNYHHTKMNCILDIVVKAAGISTVVPRGTVN